MKLLRIPISTAYHSYITTPQEFYSGLQLLLNHFPGIIKAGRSVDREVSSEYNLVVRAGNDYCGVNRTGEDTGTESECL